MEVLHQIRVDLTEDSVNPSNIAIKQWDKNSHRFWISLWEGERSICHSKRRFRYAAREESRRYPI